jgi:large subunit ribosomal protein L10
VLRDFAKTHPLLVIKGGVLDGRSVTPSEVTKLADLESRDVLLAKLAGAMKGTLTKAAVMFNQLPSQVARLAAALQEKRAAEGSAGSEVAAAAASDESPVAEATDEARSAVSAPAEAEAAVPAPAEGEAAVSAPAAAEAEVAESAEESGDTSQA